MKIDHPVMTPQQTGKDDRPSKDLADAVAGSLFLCHKLSGGNKSMDAMPQYFEHLETTKQEATALGQLHDLGLEARKRQFYNSTNYFGYGR
jgi:hypothetical protein